MTHAMPPEGPRRDWLSGAEIKPHGVAGPLSVAELVDRTFLAYNGARLREACRLFVERCLEPDVTVGVTLTGALTPAGLGASCLCPLVEMGFCDWIVSTGANVYHDAHFGLGQPLHRGSPFVDDRELREDGIIRIYDILFPAQHLFDTDAFFRDVMRSPEFRGSMGTAELHHRLGRYVAAREEKLGAKGVSLLAACHRADLPIYTSSPGDSSLGMNVAALALEGVGPRFDVERDVNETAAIVYDAKRRGGKTALLILGGGSPKNFALQTEPHIQEVLGLEDLGHDYFVQVTDARPDTGGLSGATPSEAVSWGKVDPAKLPDAVVCYLDTTVALPILTAYAVERHKPRALKRLYARREEIVERLRADYLARLAEKARD